MSMSKGLTTITRNLVGSLEKQARAVPPQRVRYLGEDKKFFQKLLKNPLTNTLTYDRRSVSGGDADLSPSEGRPP